MVGAARPAERRSDVHQGVRPVAGPIVWDHLVGEALDLRRRHRSVSARHDPAEHAPDVRVDRSDRHPEGDRRDGTSRVRTDAGQRLEGRQVGWDDPAVLVDDPPRRALEVHGPPVVAEALPRTQDVSGRRRGDRGDRGVARHEGGPGLPGPLGLRLLRHRLRDEDRPRIGRGAERQGPPARVVPGEDRLARGRRDGGRGCPGDPSPSALGPQILSITCLTTV